MSAAASPRSGACSNPALYQGTMLSKRDPQFGRGRPVAPDTFVRGSDPKAHPNYYCDRPALPQESNRAVLARTAVTGGARRPA
jgi:hypothetical protein